MEFRLNKDKTPKIVLKANNFDLEDRWILRNPGFFMSNEVGKSVKAFVNTKSKDKKLQRTRLAMAEDYFMDRMVLVKTVYYDIQDLSQPGSIRMKRKILEAQIEILNALSSNMLPEPLDYFDITNSFDHFDDSVREEFKDTEPVLILDYIPGEVLADKLQNPYDKSFYRSEDANNFNKTVGQINIEMIMRLIGDILTFEMEMYEKGYAYTALSPDHIVLLGDIKPRFIGIGRICPFSADRYDTSHVNFGRQLKAYSAPELNQRGTNFGLNASVKANIAYNLGVLIASIVLAKTDFDERLLDNGAYNYHNATEDRQAIRSSWRKKGEQVDVLLYKLMNPDPTKRLTDFDAILHELAVISGDAQDESKKETIYYGNVKFFAHDKGFGFVTGRNGVDYFVPLERVENAPSGYDGQPVAFTIVKDKFKENSWNVKAFVTPPRTDVVFPRFVKKPEAIVRPVRPTPQPTPRPQPQPIPRPQPTPVPRPSTPTQPTGTPPKKKGFFARLFGN